MASANPEKAWETVDAEEKSRTQKHTHTQKKEKENKKKEKPTAAGMEEQSHPNVPLLHFMESEGLMQEWVTVSQQIQTKRGQGGCAGKYIHNWVKKTPFSSFKEVQLAHYQVLL